MKKIRCLFKRDFDNDGKITKEYEEGADWVVNGEGKATRKYDGTCCLIKDNVLFKRREVKNGKEIPKDFIAVTDADYNTGKIMGWMPLDEHDKYHHEAFVEGLPDGTYELCGPKVASNPEKMPKHTLISHAHADVLENVPTDYDGVKEYLKDIEIEGIVWHHPDGRMVKIKKKDFDYSK